MLHPPRLEHVCWDHFKADHFPEHGDDWGDNGNHMLMASTFCMSNAPDAVYDNRKALKKAASSSSAPPPPDMSWPATGLNLQALYGLAASLNPGDKELTPVQAWFELANLYHPSLLLKPRVLEALRRELNGVVKCLHFGAVMEREAFESVVGRVVVPELYESPGIAL